MRELAKISTRVPPTLRQLLEDEANRREISFQELCIEKLSRDLVPNSVNDLAIALERINDKLDVLCRQFLQEVPGEDERFSEQPQGDAMMSQELPEQSLQRDDFIQLHGLDKSAYNRVYNEGNADGWQNDGKRWIVTGKGKKALWQNKAL